MREIAVLAFSRDGQRLAWGGSKGRAYGTGRKRITSALCSRIPAPVTTLSFSASGELLATSAGDLKARVFRVGSEERRAAVPARPHTSGRSTAWLTAGRIGSPRDSPPTIRFS